MPKALAPFNHKEIKATKYNLQMAWYHFELAHIIGQKYPYELTIVH